MLGEIMLSLSTTASDNVCNVPLAVGGFAAETLRLKQRYLDARYAREFDQIRGQIDRLSSHSKGCLLAIMFLRDCNRVTTSTAQRVELGIESKWIKSELAPTLRDEAVLLPDVEHGTADVVDASQRVLVSGSADLGNCGRLLKKRNLTNEPTQSESQQSTQQRKPGQNRYRKRLLKEPQHKRQIQKKLRQRQHQKDTQQRERLQKQQQDAQEQQPQHRQQQQQQSQPQQPQQQQPQLECHLCAFTCCPSNEYAYVNHLINHDRSLSPDKLCETSSSKGESVSQSDGESSSTDSSDSTSHLVDRSPASPRTRGASRIHKCCKCEYRTCNGAVFGRHQRHHGAMALWACRRCDFACDSERLYVVHRTQHHAKLNNNSASSVPTACVNIKRDINEACDQKQSTAYANAVVVKVKIEPIHVKSEPC